MIMNKGGAARNNYYYTKLVAPINLTLTLSKSKLQNFEAKIGGEIFQKVKIIIRIRNSYVLISIFEF